MMGLVRDLTRSCERVDCSITFGAYTSTLLGWTPTYNKFGKQTSKDPNYRTQTARCLTCNKTWYITERDDEETKIVLLKG